MEFIELLNYNVPVWAVLVINGVYYLFMAAVASMEMPGQKATPRYRFWFRFLNRIAANLERARRANGVPPSAANSPQ